jgi:excinuclease ABC subunit A
MTSHHQSARSTSRTGRLEVYGANQHNLKNVDLTLPKNAFIVFTGVSGSGKSSMALDTLYAEGQRRYIESLSAYARQFLGQMDKPLYHRIVGLAPTIAIDQKTASSNPRSTVGTITEIYDYQRVLFARAGQQHCHLCGARVGRHEPSQIVEDIVQLPEGSRILVLAPVARNRKGAFTEVFSEAMRGGYIRARIDGDIVQLSADMALDGKRKHDIDIVVDRTVVRSDDRARLTDSIETALRQGQGKVAISVYDAAEQAPAPPDRDLLYSETLFCDRCGVGFSDPTPAHFSFNTPVGACQDCNGLGIALEVDPTRVVVDDALSVRGGAIVPWANQAASKSWTSRKLAALCREYGLNLDTPWRDLSKAHKRLVLFGADRRIDVDLDGVRGKGTWAMRFEGVIPQTKRRWKETSSARMRDYYEQFFAERTCSTCHGKRLRPQSCAVTIGDKRIHELGEMTVDALLDWYNSLELHGAAAQIASEVVKEIQSRLRFLCNVGLGYLCLSRNGQSLSGGESQRIRLASQVGSELSGVLYVLDEPSIGLHSRDTGRLLQTLCELRDLGNTVLVVEHDEATMRAADHLVDFGPGAGQRGGRIVADGLVEDLVACDESVTGAYLGGKRQIDLPQSRRSAKDWLRLQGASANNLRDISVEVPLGCLTVVTGVSGAGKSSLVNLSLVPLLRLALTSGGLASDGSTHLKGALPIAKVVEIDQNPIGRTPRSNPATYSQVWGRIREVFASLPAAKVAGYGPGRFSFNIKGGRCEHCKGSGVLKVEMHFLADVYVPCEVCLAKRFNEATLEVLYKGHHVADVLAMTIEQAYTLFEHHPGIARILRTLVQVGVGYLSLGQTAPTLSGGEAQRVKLAKELARPTTGRTLYVLDEPTTGLHFEDIQRLIDVLQTLVDHGNSVLVVEHQLDMIKVADHLIDLGPEGGKAGGTVVVAGTPEEVAACPQSHTGVTLRAVL